MSKRGLDPIAKKAMYLVAQQSLATTIGMLLAAGESYTSIDKQLFQRRSHGMTSWSIAKKWKKKK